HIQFHVLADPNVGDVFESQGIERMFNRLALWIQDSLFQRHMNFRLHNLLPCSPDALVNSSTYRRILKMIATVAMPPTARAANAQRHGESSTPYAISPTGPPHTTTAATNPSVKNPFNMPFSSSFPNPKERVASSCG